MARPKKRGSMLTPHRLQDNKGMSAYARSLRRDVACGSGRRTRRMRVFISHTFGGDDESLASALGDSLRAAGMDAYMAEKTPRYDIPISDKIRQEIGESDWLVAIITRRSQTSASVHQEIGYALGRGIRVALMVERGVEKSGVFTYGRDVEFFTLGEFKQHSIKVAEFIKNSPPSGPRQGCPTEEAAEILTDRNIASENSPRFAENKHFTSLYSSVPDAEKPVALFTAYPHKLATDGDVTSEEFIEWAESTTSIEVDGRRVRMPGFDHSVDIGALHTFETRVNEPYPRNVLTYREFQSNGLCEFGTSYAFFDYNSARQRNLHLCYMIGEFWVFLAHARLFYKKIRLNSPLTTLLSIKNSDKLALGNYGDDVVCPAPSFWVQSRLREPTTDHWNIRLPHAFRSVGEMTDESIAQAAKKAAKDICNAYGKITPNCYDAKGNFSWKLWSIVTHRVMGGGWP